VAEDLIGPDEIAYRLELTAAQLKIVHTALRALFDDLGHDERDVKQVVAAVLDKLPGEHEIRAIDLGHELRRTSE
jgi:UDP-N-acetylmuramate-alanine ligase